MSSMRWKRNGQNQKTNSTANHNFKHRKRKQHKKKIEEEKESGEKNDRSKNLEPTSRNKPTHTTKKRKPGIRIKYQRYDKNNQKNWKITEKPYQKRERKENKNITKSMLCM